MVMDVDMDDHGYEYWLEEERKVLGNNLTNGNKGLVSLLFIRRPTIFNYFGCTHHYDSREE